jgi:branched-chain amino acid transport system ATP-binding protein
MLLDVQNLSITYGAASALNDISFFVDPGEIVVLVGPNGAGKSTALRAVSGILASLGGRIAGGDIVYDGRSIAGLRPDQLVARGITLAPEGRRLFCSLSVRENLEMGGFRIHDSRRLRGRINYVLDLFPALRGRLSQSAGTLSGGEQQMLALGRALMIEPKLLLVDEPLLGLSPNFVDITMDKLREIGSGSTSILMVEQNVRMALDLCHRGYVFENGRVALTGTKSELLASTKIHSVYLGGE